jgi:predicted small metal-binding protein
MKAMTCAQLGGPCDLRLSGATADEVIHAQDRHLREAVQAGDDTHAEALRQMKGRWKNPLSGLSWYRGTKRAFAALPEDAGASSASAGG